MRKFNFNLLYLVLIFSSAACQSTPTTSISSDIIDSGNIIKITSLDNAYLRLDTDDKQYYAGFTVDQNNINHPTLVELDKESGKIGIWNFDEIIADIFIFNNKVSLVFDQGDSFSLQDNIWHKNSLVLEEQSRIVFSDAKNHLISCSPASPLKSDPISYGCQSHNPDWQISFSWRGITPKVCGDYLYAVTWEQPANRHIIIDVKSGKLKFEKNYSGEDICTPFE